ncbi:MAG: holo-ACP synthase [Firmicutes bacterium]|nr:holo-ACP synthase [Bacillota bacterium]
MIFGIGCDLCDIDRIKKANERFFIRCFTPAENELFVRKKNRFETAAANFAAKEAFSKALGMGVCGFALSDVEVLRSETGKPFIKLYGNAEKLCRDRGINGIFVSLSHTSDIAVAYVVLEL